MRIELEEDAELPLPPVNLASSSDTRVSSFWTKFLRSSTTWSVKGAIVLKLEELRGGRGARRSREGVRAQLERIKKRRDRSCRGEVGSYFGRDGLQVRVLVPGKITHPAEISQHVHPSTGALSSISKNRSKVFAGFIIV